MPSPWGSAWESAIQVRQLASDGIAIAMVRHPEPQLRKGGRTPDGRRRGRPRRCGLYIAQDHARDDEADSSHDALMTPCTTFSALGIPAIPCPGCGDRDRGGPEG